MIKLKQLMVENEERIIEVPIDQLDYFKWYSDGGCDEEHWAHQYGNGNCVKSIQSLAKEFKIRGYFLDPIEIKKRGDRWMVMDGHHRVNAAKIANLKIIPAKIVKN
jgi:hypothetical protein